MCFDPNTDFTDMEFTEQELSVAVIESSTIGSIEGAVEWHFVASLKVLDCQKEIICWEV